MFQILCSAFKYNPVCMYVSCLNPLSPHDALEHHFTSLKTDSIPLQLERFFL